MTKKTTALDPRSDRVALVYTGDDSGHPAIDGVPARNLTESDLCRLLYIRADESAEAAAALIAELAATTIYRMPDA